MQKITFTKAFVGDHWQDNVLLDINDHGLITAIHTDVDQKTAAHTEFVDGYALSGMPNSHSHAFQRAMAGLTEYATSGKENFWTWRDVMYRFAQMVTPDDLYHIARQLYLEMAMAGYTSVAEFHYLHHQAGGQPYDNPTEMSLSIIEAAKDVGLNLTHLPVLYMSSGFGGGPLQDQQARFGHTSDAYCILWHQLHQILNDHTKQKLGAAFHSLRAVTPQALDAVVTHVRGYDDTAPLHIHMAEQMSEVDDCVAWSGQRPVEWLLNHHNLDAGWCLVHATHMTEYETQALAESGAVVSLCPTTEANLGDGFFPLKSYLDSGGRIAIGSDSHISVSPIAELRLLEYGQRLIFQKRNIAATQEMPHTGQRLYCTALKGGAQAAGFNSGRLEVGKTADLITIDPASPLLVGTPDKYLLDRYIFNGNHCPVKDVMTAGKWIVKDRNHPKSEEIGKNFCVTMKKLGRLLG